MDENDARAFELIEDFASELRRLTNGKPLPAKWRDHLEEELGLRHKRGRPPGATTRVLERDIPIADEMLRAYLAIKLGTSKESITQVAERIAARHLKTAEDIFHISNRYQNEALAAELVRRLDASDEELSD